MLHEKHMDPILIDSNGVGGFHLIVLLDKEYPIADVHAFAAEPEKGSTCFLILE